MKFRSFVSLCLSLTATLMLTACMGGGSKSVGIVDTPPPSVPNENPVNPDVIRRGDVLFIRLTGVPAGEEMSVEDTVSPDAGVISLPLLGNFKAAGKTSTQLKSEIEAAYRDKKLYTTPNVTVSLEQRFINVLGEVRSPQRVGLTGDMTFLRALTACGGFTDYAKKREVRLMRAGKVYIVDAVEILKDPSKDIPLQAGDQIQVVRTIF